MTLSDLVSLCDDVWDCFCLHLIFFLVHWNRIVIISKIIKSLSIVRFQFLIFKKVISLKMHTGKSSKNYLLNTAYSDDMSQVVFRVSLLRSNITYLQIVIISMKNLLFSLHCDCRNLGRKCYILLQRYNE